MTALREIVEDLDITTAGVDISVDLSVDLSVDVGGISDDSRMVCAGDLFVAVAGADSDGHDYAAQAVTSGAVAVLAERSIADLVELHQNVPVVLIADLKQRRSEIAARLYHHPSRDLNCVGITGTNGKTSIACFLAEMAEAVGQPAGYMGTIGWGSPGHLEPSRLTTESAIIIQQRLVEFREQGKQWAVLEASSHALDQHRLDGVAFDYAVFTNLTRDHLDYHDDFESYGAAKVRLFQFPDLKAAIVNTDDAFGSELAGRLRGSMEIVTCGENPAADVCWRSLSFHSDGVVGWFDTPWGSAEFEMPLYGSFSVANVAAALAVLCHSGVALTDVVAVLPEISPVPGRMEFFRGTPTVVVDYAHTPDALAKMLAALRPHLKTGRLICVCGCGGDRDRGKRPLMARAACEHADQVWLTSDNPRSEDPAAIIEDMLAGTIAAADVQVQVDRRRAIEAAYAGAAATDLVVVAGKGHEDYQEVQGQRLPFDDRAVAAELTASIAHEGRI